MEQCLLAIILGSSPVLVFGAGGIAGVGKSNLDLPAASLHLKDETSKRAIEYASIQFSLSLLSAVQNRHMQ